MKKTRTKYICQSCGYESPRWMGRCSECQSWNTFVEELVSFRAVEGKNAFHVKQRPQSISEIQISHIQRLQTGVAEFDRVVGGGIVPGSVFIFAGAPGMGKSTLLLQVGNKLAEKENSVLYISGEESIQQIKLRAERLSVNASNFRLLTETHVEAIVEILKEEKPGLAVVDSIQTVYSSEMESIPGNISQVRYCGHLITVMAKETGIPVCLIGHVTKEGNIAGPRVLEHLVDGLFLLEGDPKHLYRLVRAVKNRFGSTNEIGLFEMTDQGLREVNEPAEFLLTEREEPTSGTAVTVTVEGSRSLLVEVQALVTHASYGVPQRTTTGIDHKRLSILLAVLEKRVGFKFGNQDVFVNAAGGLKITEPGVDLAVAAAVVSSFREKPLNHHTVFIGEVGLTGEIRGISQMEKRISEMDRMGYKRIILPKVSLKRIRKNSRIEFIGVQTLRECMDYILKS